jgi:voltage-gated potassium channel
MRVFRMLAVLRLYRIVQSYSGFDYELGVLAFTIFTLIFVAAGVIQVLDEDYYKEQGQDPLQFHQCVYFVFVTMSTVGYGDISPRTTACE